MTWLALRESNARVMSLGEAKNTDRLEWGTLVLEIDLGEIARSRSPILRLLPQREPERMFTLETMDDGRLHLLRRQGKDVSHLSIGLGREPGSGCLRLTYHWDKRHNRSLLTAENLSKGTIRQHECRTALPLLCEEIEALFSADGRRPAHPGLNWVALADHWQTVGPMPGLAPHTMIATTEGPRPIAAICPGDLVLTADDGPLPVLWQGRVQVPAIGRFHPVRLVAPYFGLKHDVIVQPSQRIAVSGADIEYHFGEKEVLVEARNLVNGMTAVQDYPTSVTSCHGLLLDRHALISASGIWTESLYFGRIAMNPDLARTTAPVALNGLAQLPVHSGAVRRELREFEARALNVARLQSRSPVAA